MNGTGAISGSSATAKQPSAKLAERGGEGGAFARLLGSGAAAGQAAGAEASARPQAATSDSADGARQPVAVPNAPDERAEAGAQPQPPPKPQAGEARETGERALLERVAEGEKAELPQAVADARGESALPRASEDNAHAEGVSEKEAAAGAVAALMAPTEARRGAAAAPGRAEAARSASARSPAVDAAAAALHADAEAELRAATRMALQAAPTLEGVPTVTGSERLTLPAALQQLVGRAQGGSARGGAAGESPGAVMTALPTSAPTVSSAPATPMMPVSSASPQQLAETAARLMVQSVAEGKWQASLRLDPPELGRVEVQMGRDQSALSAHFVTATSGARAALEQALPQLAQQLAEQGMSLGDSSVSQQHSGDGSSPHAPEATPEGSAPGGDAETVLPLIPESGAALRARGLFEGWA